MLRVFTLSLVTTVLAWAIATSAAMRPSSQPEPLVDAIRRVVQQTDSFENLEFARFRNQDKQQVADLGFFGLEGRLTLGQPGPKGTQFEAVLGYRGLEVNWQGRQVAWLGKTRGKDGGIGRLDLNRPNGQQSIALSADSGAHFRSTNGRELVFVGIETRGGDREVGVVRVNGKDVADYSEVFELATRVGVVPGTVMSVVESGLEIAPSAVAYDAKVVGVISGAGGLSSGMQLGGRQDETDDLPIALAGQVYVRVTTEGGPLSPGDLLVSSGRPGTAMRAADRTRAMGAVLGKALQPFDGKVKDGSGEGLIRMLVMNR